MRLFVKNSNTREKIYLRKRAKTRKELTEEIGDFRFSANDNVFTVEDVIAEKNSDSTSFGMAIGGAVGIIGGPLGVVFGGVIGGLIGNDEDNKESQMVKIFNDSQL